MKLNHYLAIVFLLVGSGQLAAQNAINHFSMFDMAPLTLNPAYTGAYEGTLRLGGIYRDQWSSFLPNQFTTPSFYVDAPLVMVRKRDWVGAGVNIYTDKAGSGDLGNTGVMGSVSYHLALDKKYTNVLTFGFQLGSVNRRINQNGLTFGDELGPNGVPSSADRGNIDEKASFIDMGAGLLFKSRINKTMRLDLGFSLLHLTTPQYNLISSNSNRNDENLPMQFIMHGRFNVDLSKKWILSPGFLFQSISGANEIALQTSLGYRLNEENPTIVKFGTGYRLRDAVEVLLGLEYKDLLVGLAYDVNVSDLTQATSGRGGFEVAVGYIIKIYKQPDVKPVFLCPRI